MSVAFALLPVTAFLVLLVFADSFKLVPTLMLLRALAAGAVAALLAYPVNTALGEALGVSQQTFTRYVAPVTEETLKLAVLLYPLWKRQVGFLVDAAILGFAIGAGFALVENVQYLRTLQEQSVWVWVTRGFGTALLHGLTTAVVAIGAKSLHDR